ncbi:serine hydrolase domain-containing protein [Croceicoccus sediminis]|uniref:serine hydrolase domain-containing protein n=1 Tax=Croceicoccus sediminis TaxID=2571150 RepID=UPI0014795E42|nr:serine hydrolase domain-containing protein [Croceicoccus sediminis]
MTRNLALCSPLILAALALSPVEARADAIQDIANAELDRSGAPGMALAVVQDGRVVRVEAFGEADIEHGVKVHPDTMFKTGATGMPFTAALMMLLVEDGQIALDNPVSAYLPGTPDKWSGVTIRHLIENTSGLPATPNGDFLAEYTRQEMLAIIAAQDINFAPGTRYRFSYANYVVLGMVIEEVTGVPWSEFARQRLFGPLGMTTARGIDELAIIPNRAKGYEVRDGELRNAEWISAAANSTADGSLYLSALDFAAWGQALSRRLLLRETSWEELDHAIALRGGATCAAAPGWFMEGTGNDLARWQAGVWQGFRTYALNYPGRDISVFVLANGEAANAKDVARRVGRTLDAGLPLVPARPAESKPSAATRHAMQLVDEMIAGKAQRSDYADFADLDFRELTEFLGGMLAALGPVQSFALYEKREDCSETLFRIRTQHADGNAEIRMGLDKQQRITSLDVVPIGTMDEPL